MENDNAAEQDANAERVNTNVMAVPIPDVYLFQNNPTTHVVNGTDYAQARARGETSTTALCGQVEVEVPVGPDDNLPETVQHLADALDADEVFENAEGVMSLSSFNVCGRCRASYGYDGVPEGMNVVSFKMDGSGWER